LPGPVLRHGAYALVHLSPRAAEIADALRPLVPAYSPSDEAALQNLAITTARVEAAERALAQVDAAAGDQPVTAFIGEAGEKLARLREDLRGWLGLARRLQHDLGLSPRARFELGLTAAKAHALAEHSAEDDEWQTWLKQVPIRERVRLVEALAAAEAAAEEAS
jgi:hypothetical protein